MRPYLMALLVPLAACGNGDESSAGVPGAGTGDARSFAVADFTAVSLRGPDDVDVRVGSAFSVRATGPEAELARLHIERVGDTLRIRRERGVSWNGGKGVRVAVTMPRIVGAELAGSGDMTVDQVEGPRFHGEIAGSGDLSIAALQTGEAKLSIAGSGSMKTAGRTDRLGIDIAGAGDVVADGLTASSATVSIAGSGNVRVKVNGAANVDIVGSGDVDLGAGARCQVSKVGSGTVRCGG